MYPTLHQLFADIEEGKDFVCFGFWHIFYIVLAIAATAFFILCLRKKDQNSKNRTLAALTLVPFALYMADIFLMPFAYGEIDVDKLPFHACTGMCVACFLSSHVKWLKKFRVNFAMLALVTNLIYLCYPSGVMAYEIHPLSYRVIQTMLFHSSMAVACLLILMYDEHPLQGKKCYRDLILLVGMTIWAFIGNTLYSGAAGDYDRDFNWFFIRQDPLDILPEAIAPYIAPFMNIVVFFVTALILYGIFGKVRKARKQPAACESIPV